MSKKQSNPSPPNINVVNYNAASMIVKELQALNAHMKYIGCALNEIQFILSSKENNDGYHDD